MYDMNEKNVCTLKGSTALKRFITGLKMVPKFWAPKSKAHPGPPESK